MEVITSEYDGSISYAFNDEELELIIRVLRVCKSCQLCTSSQDPAALRMAEQMEEELRYKKQERTTNEP